MRNLELLAPARDVSIAREAILHGADAVYIGGPSHGARAAAANSVADIAELTQFAHLYGVRVYVTLNTIIYDSEIPEVEATIRALYHAGVDALIVQDMGILRMDIPPIDLHASTQCDIRTPEKALFLAQCGFSQLVLPRELSLSEIREVRRAVPHDVALEAFVHGALCVSYSGDCQASAVAKGRSANRGECAQMCRLPYSLIDDTGRVLLSDKHLLSLRDLNRLPDLEALADAGISSFKIEGRLKDAAYVKQTVAAYRQALDRIIAANPERYCRASWGESKHTFTPDLEKAFNRGFTPYFLNGRPTAPIKMANLDTPKWVGQPVGKVIKSQGLTLTAHLTTALSNGDGLGYYDRTGNFSGFRVNRVDGQRIYLTQPLDIAPGTQLYRNRDTLIDSILAKSTASRLIPIEISLTPIPAEQKEQAEPAEGQKGQAESAEVQKGQAVPAEVPKDKGYCAAQLSCAGLRLTLIAAAGPQSVSVSVEAPLAAEEAHTPQKAARARALAKLGGTAFSPASVTDELSENAFVPLSLITDMRQRAVKQLTERITANHTRRERLQEDTTALIAGNTRLTYHENVANRLARTFYTDHGATAIEAAIETQKTSDKPLRVMTTRYCLRRELGACLRESTAGKLPKNLYLTNDTATYRVEFDCKNCQMMLYTAKKP